MASGDTKKTALVGTILEEEVVLTLFELCRASCLSVERVIELADEGIIEPIGRNPNSWRFHGASLQRIRCAQRLEADLGVNLAGVALVLDLLDQLEALRVRIGRLES